MAYCAKALCVLLLRHAMYTRVGRIPVIVVLKSEWRVLVMVVLAKKTLILQ